MKVVGTIPTSAKHMMIVPSFNGVSLPSGWISPELSDVTTGTAAAITGTISITGLGGLSAGQSFKNDPAIHVILAKAIVATLPAGKGITEDMVQIMNITVATSRRLEQGSGRRLAAGDISIVYMIIAPAGTSIVAADISAATLKTQMKTAATSMGSTTVANTVDALPTAAFVAAAPTVEEAAGNPTASAFAAKSASPAMAFLLVSMLFLVKFFN